MKNTFCLRLLSVFSSIYQILCILIQLNECMHAYTYLCVCYFPSISWSVCGFYHLFACERNWSQCITGGNFMDSMMSVCTKILLCLETFQRHRFIWQKCSRQAMYAYGVEKAIYVWNVWLCTHPTSITWFGICLRMVHKHKTLTIFDNGFVEAVICWRFL